ncbi:MAG: hypothetical protein JST40_10735 [Armatimonadetes bacterium]|nr:hypothetical protein [Armatimonadota bacterium]
MSDPIFSEEQVTQIVKRAVQLQEQHQAANYQPGVTPDELKRIASELGVDPQYLELAIREKLNSSSGNGSGLLKWKNQTERVVDGEISTDDFGEVIRNFGHAMRNSPPTLIGRTLTCRTFAGLNLADVTVTARNGRTKVEVNTVPFLNLIFGLQAGIMGTAIGSSLIAEKGLVGAGVAVLAAGAAAVFGLVVGGTIWGHKKGEALANKIQQDAQALVDENVRDNLAKSTAAPSSISTTSANEQSTQTS